MSIRPPRRIPPYSEDRRHSISDLRVHACINWPNKFLPFYNADKCATCLSTTTEITYSLSSHLTPLAGEKEIGDPIVLKNWYDSAIVIDKMYSTNFLEIKCPLRLQAFWILYWSCFMISLIIFNWIEIT